MKETEAKKEAAIKEAERVATQSIDWYTPSSLNPQFLLLNSHIVTMRLPHSSFLKITQMRPSGRVVPKSWQSTSFHSIICDRHRLSSLSSALVDHCFKHMLAPLGFLKHLAHCW